MTARRPPSTYPSKRDAWIEILLWIGAGAFMLWMLYGTSYTLTDERLIIRSGPFRWRIALQAIHSVDPSRSLLSSPAVSLDRLRVRHGPSRRSVLISPDDKERFLWDLAARAPGLELVGNRLRRAT